MTLTVLDKASQYFTAKKVKLNRRGDFPFIAHGISYGGGQEVGST